MVEYRSHRRVRMGGRDPAEEHRAATPLELLFDLTFVIAFGTAANELAHQLAEGHFGAALLGFSLATFAIAWAWINFSWFASAYDTDDWIFRLATMVQMVGVLVFALGLPDMFASLYEGETVDNRVMVAGYVVMRLALVFQWLRAARQDPDRRGACHKYVTTLLVAQAGWIALAVAETSVAVTFLWVAVLLLVETGGPVLAETRHGGTPWHPHHIAERHGLLVIIALGEGLLGTAFALSVLVGPEGPGWSVEVVVLGLAGTALTFGMWWIYFILPMGGILERHRERSFGWGYGHIPLFGALAAVGAGLHAAAYYLEHHSVLGTTGTVLTVAIPVALYVVTICVLYYQLSRVFDPFHLLLLAGTAVVVLASIGMAAAGTPMVWCLAVLALTPWVTVVGYETVGYRHGEESVARL
ncbi:low temperature requirement protein A [Blastococcus sp. CT_GayMR19]|uniref:low temperature requirement protein A n=1 Tax=Blastococcus sp. CT_GayMR19 TaxID=2559608 RepID=UPI001FD826F7|nr:low temperature requirement protein A [Blastococcus sp. CT_GayMR19]